MKHPRDASFPPFKSAFMRLERNKTEPKSCLVHLATNNRVRLKALFIVHEAPVHVPLWSPEDFQNSQSGLLL